MPAPRIEKLCVKEESVIAEILGFDDEPYSQARMEFVIVEQSFAVTVVILYKEILVFVGE